MRSLTPLFGYAERVFVPAFPGTKYGETMSSSCWGSPIACFRSARSRSFLLRLFQRLSRRVVEQLDTRPIELKLVREEGFDQPGLPDGLDVFGGFGRRANRGKTRLQVRNAIRSGLAHDPVGRIRGVAVPIEIECPGDFARDAPRRHHIEVHEERPLAGAEILVADVATPHDRELRVRGEGLVVHPAVQPLEMGDVAERFEAAVRVRVVETNLDVGVRVENGEDRVQPLDAVVVEQHPHAHAALGGIPELLEQEEPGDVGMPDVVLHVERALRRAREHDPGGKGVPSLRERVDSALVLSVPGGRPHRLAESRVRRFGESRRGGSPVQRGKRGASANASAATRRAPDGAALEFNARLGPRRQYRERATRLTVTTEHRSPQGGAHGE